MFINPINYVFENEKIIASGIAHTGAGTYSSALFLVDFPQFKKNGQGTSLVPDTMLQTFIGMANDSIFPDVWGSSYQYAAGLFVAHFCAMYLQTYADGSPNAAAVAGNSGNVGTVKSATMGDTSVSYDNSAVTAGTEKWGTWNATKYGAQLVTLARSLGIAGSYVI